MGLQARRAQTVALVRPDLWDLRDQMALRGRRDPQDPLVPKGRRATRHKPGLGGTLPRAARFHGLPG